MAGGMLPGVELARKRRVHHHDVQPPRPTPPSAARRRHPPPADQAEAMDEPALLARRRLEEKLRRFDMGMGTGPTPPPPPSPSSFSRWIRHVVMGEGGERSRGGGAAAASNHPTSKGGGVLRRRDSIMDVCAVCLDEVEAQQTRAMRLPCSHIYHSDCLLPWLAAHSHCPCCRTFVPSLDLLLL